MTASPSIDAPPRGGPELDRDCRLAALFGDDVDTPPAYGQAWDVTREAVARWVHAEGRGSLRAMTFVGLLTKVVTLRLGLRLDSGTGIVSATLLEATPEDWCGAVLELAGMEARGERQVEGEAFLAVQAALQEEVRDVEDVGDDEGAEQGGEDEPLYLTDRDPQGMDDEILSAAVDKILGPCVEDLESDDLHTVFVEAGAAWKWVNEETAWVRLPEDVDLPSLDVRTWVEIPREDFEREAAQDASMGSPDCWRRFACTQHLPSEFDPTDVFYHLCDHLLEYGATFASGVRKVLETYAVPDYANEPERLLRMREWLLRGPRSRARSRVFGLLLLEGRGQPELVDTMLDDEATGLDGFLIANYAHIACMPRDWAVALVRTARLIARLDDKSVVEGGFSNPMLEALVRVAVADDEAHGTPFVPGTLARFVDVDAAPEAEDDDEEVWDGPSN